MFKQVKLLIIGSIIVGLLAIIIFTLSYIFLYNNGVKDLDKKIQEVDKKIQEYEKKLTRLSELAQKHLEIQAKEKRAKEMIPDLGKSGFDDFIKDITKLSDNAGTKLIELKPQAKGSAATGKPAPPPEIISASYDIKISGNFSRVTELLKFLENYSRFIYIDGFTLTRSKEKEEEKAEAINLVVTVTTYAYKVQDIQTTQIEKIQSGSKTTPPPY